MHNNFEWENLKERDLVAGLKSSLYGSVMSEWKLNINWVLVEDIKLAQDKVH
jgi:hypothetical protein